MRAERLLNIAVHLIILSVSFYCIVYLSYRMLH